MSGLPPEIDFVRNASASPERMDDAARHLDGRLRAIEASKSGLAALEADLKSFGVERVNAVLLPIIADMQALLEDAAAIHAALAAPAARDQLVADARDAVLAAIAADKLYVRDGAQAGIALFTGTSVPDAGTGEEGDIHIYVDPNAGA